MQSGNGLSYRPHGFCLYWFHPGVTGAQLPRWRQDRQKPDRTKPQTAGEGVAEGAGGGIVKTRIGV